MKQLVKLWERPSFDGKRFKYYLLYTDGEGKRRQRSLGHANRQKAERERAQLERHLYMALSDAAPMTLKQFVEVSLDRGNSRATVAKKLRHLKCIFAAGVKRRLLDENPFQFISMPRYSKNDIRTYGDRECEQLLKAAQDFVAKFKGRAPVRWDLLVVVALSTGMRRGELLNCTWNDIDFEQQTIRVAPKHETTETWEWLVKDTDRRALPLTDEMTQLLADHQSQQPVVYPYVFVPPARYDYIQNKLRATGRWTYSDSRLKVINNFTRDFSTILQRANIEDGEFHDLRRTAICNWLKEGMGEFDVMKLAGHADFRTTHRFYLRVRDDLVHRARRTTSRGLCRKLLQSPIFTSIKKDKHP